MVQPTLLQRSIMQLYVDKSRIEKVPACNIFVRAKAPDGSYVSVDIAHLKKDSLLKWLRSRGGENKWAENVVGILLGYGYLHDEGEQDEHEKETLQE